MTGIVVIILIFDGIVTNLPFYDLQSRQVLAIQLFFVIEVLICALCQIFFLQIIKRKYDINPPVGHFRKYTNITYRLVSVAQYLIIGILLIAILEIEFLSQYHTILLSISILLSLLLSIGVSGLLAFRLVPWIRHEGDYLIITFTVCCYPHKYQFDVYCNVCAVRISRQTLTD